MFEKIIGYLLIVVPILFTLVQLVQVKKARIASLLYSIYSDIHSEPNIIKREELYKLDLSNYSALSDNELRLVDDVVDLFCRISFLSQQKLIPQKYIIMMYSGIIIKVWEYCKDYIYTKRFETGVSNYAVYLEQMYPKVIKYRIKNNWSINIKR